MFVLGTAGHVDHGKSTLLRSLTGQEPDRLLEEKRRKMTIELNFVYLRSPRFGMVGIIDVPGHRRFVKNMVSGVTSIDGAIFAVAADDGWMPQSEEHLRILEALGIRHAIGVVTKGDLVGRERVSEITRDVELRLKSVFMDPKVVTFYPSDTGALARLRGVCEELLARLPPPRDRGIARIWIDRVFTPQGQGAVVTGTLQEGSVRTGDRLFVLPKQGTCTVRAIHSYGEGLDRQGPRHRVALQVKADGELCRGDCLSSVKSPASALFDARVRWFREPRLPAQLALLVGSWHGSATFTRVVEDVYRVRVAGLPVRFADTILIRSPGGEELLGVGTILDPFPPKKFADSAKHLLGVRNAADFIRQKIERTGYLSDEAIRDQTNLSPEETAEATKGYVRLQEGYTSSIDWPRWVEKVRYSITSEGVSQERIAKGLKGHPVLVKEALEVLVREKQIEKRAYGYTLPTAKEVVRVAVPSKVAELGRDIQIKIRRLILDGSLVQLTDHVIDQASYASHVEAVRRHLSMTGHATTSELKQHLGLSRNHAVLLLERMDRDRVTYLKDGVRRLLKARE